MSAFKTSLDQLHRSRIGMRLVVMILVLLTIYGLSMLLHGLADFHFALSQSARKTTNALIAGAVIILGVVWCIRILRTPRVDTALVMDNLLKDSSHRLLSATYLERMEADTEMKKFHLDRALDSAGRDLEKLPLKARFPIRAVSIGIAAVAVTSAVLLAIKQLAPKPFNVVYQRLFDTDADIAPYSPLVFSVTPSEPNAIYGGDVTVQVDITGGEITEDVYCLIRDSQSGKIEKVTTFREDLGKYARKFENTLNQFEFAFTTGRARSAWHKLDVLYQPRVSSAKILLTPPAYTGKKPVSYSLDSSEIKVLEGSTVSLSLQSNRPLSGGVMQVFSMDRSRESLPQEVRADLTGEQEVTFSWSLHRSSRISALIKDIRTTPAYKPLELTLVSVPDQVPVVDVAEPQPMVLATPRSKLPMSATVTDDHGLAKVSLVRALVGYRDRARLLADALVSKDYDFKDSIEMEDLGVEPGQTLEFFFEASDRNPSLLGVGVSDVVRVRIISEDDYAQRIRASFKLDKFTARYRALADALKQSREALRNLDEAADLGDEEAFEKARKEAQDIHDRAEKLAKQLAEDFKAFDMEERLKETARQVADTLNENKQQMKQIKFADSEAKMRQTIREMQKRLGGIQKKADQVVQDAALMKKAGKVLEMAARYRRLLNVQRSIVERFGEIAKEVAKGRTDNTNRLEGLSRVQARNRENLLKLAEELRKRADALPDELNQMKLDVDEFLTELERMDIQNPMKTASESAAKGKSTDAYTNALLALNLMEQLLEKPKNGF